MLQHFIAGSHEKVAGLKDSIARSVVDDGNFRRVLSRIVYPNFMFIKSFRECLPSFLISANL